LIISYSLISVLIICRLLIDFLYFSYVLDFYAYEGYTGSLDSYVINFFPSLIFLIPFLINNTQKINISNYLIFILLVGILFPASSLFAFGGITTSWFLINFFFFLVITFANYFLSKADFQSIAPNDYSAFNFLLFTITAIASIVFISRFGINLDFELFSFDSELIASQRKLYKSMAAPAGVTGYLIANFYNLIIPVLFGYSIIFRNKIIFIISLFLCMIAFSATSARALPFTLGLFYAIIKINRFNDHPKQYDYMKGYFIVLLIVGIIFFIIPKESPLIIIPALVFNRTIFSAQLVSFSYYNFFQTHNYTYFLDTTIGSIIGKNYHTDLPLEIGRIFFNNANANTGIISDGYAKMGLLGVFISAIVLLIILRIIEFLSNKKNLLLVKVIMTLPIFVLINGSIFTSVLTNGLLLSLIFISLIPLDKVDKVVNNVRN